MPKLVATFPDGRQLRRNSKFDYTHAWRVCALAPLNTDGKPVNSVGQVLSKREWSESGFASSEELAAKAAASVARRVEKYGGMVTSHDVVAVAATKETTT